MTLNLWEQSYGKEELRTINIFKKVSLKEKSSIIPNTKTSYLILLQEK